MLESHRVAAPELPERQRTEWHANTAKQVNAAAIGGYAEGLEPWELRLFEFVAGGRLRRLGYDAPKRPPRPAPDGAHPLHAEAPLAAVQDPRTDRQATGGSPAAPDRWPTRGRPELGSDLESGAPCRAGRPRRAGPRTCCCQQRLPPAAGPGTRSPPVAGEPAPGTRRLDPRPVVLARPPPQLGRPLRHRGQGEHRHGQQLVGRDVVRPSRVLVRRGAAGRRGRRRRDSRRSVRRRPGASPRPRPSPAPPPAARSARRPPRPPSAAPACSSRRLRADAR